MKVAIIGAGGFVGSHLVGQLSNLGINELFLFGKNMFSPFDKKYWYSSIDLTDSNQIFSLFKEIDIVYYLVSSSIPASTWENPKNEIESNLLPFINFLECISKLKVKKIIFTSSAGTIYGTSNDYLKEDSNKSPFSPHGITKLTMEYYLNYFDVKYGLKSEIFRVSNIYGEGQNTNKGLGIINTFLESIKALKEINVYGDGKIIRNYIYVKDVARALALACNLTNETSSIYNLSSDDSLSINEVIEYIKVISKEKFKINYTETRASDNPKILLDNTKFKNDFQNFKFTPIQEGIYNTYLNIIKKL